MEILRTIFVLALLGIGACGKYGKPVSPEAFAPGPINNLAATQMGEVLEISWQAPQSNRRGGALDQLEGYNVLRAEKSADNYLQLAKLSSNQTSFKDEKLLNDKTYLYKVVAFNSIGGLGSVQRLLRVKYDTQSSKIETIKVSEETSSFEVTTSDEQSGY